MAGTIYDKPVRMLMRDMVQQLGLRPGAVLKKNQVVEWFRQNYPKIKLGTINGHLNRLSTNDRNRLHHQGLRADDDLLYRIDPTTFRLYEPGRDPSPLSATDGAGAAGEGSDAIDAGELPGSVTDKSADPSEFAYEEDLRDFLSRNLHIIEPGMRLYVDGEITGVEFDVGGRFIDILAFDSAGACVVIELKVSRGYDRVVGQLLRYMAWIRHHHAEPQQRVRGVIVARTISADLRLACSEVEGVRLYEYQLQVSLRECALSESTQALTSRQLAASP